MNVSSQKTLNQTPSFFGKGNWTHARGKSVSEWWIQSDFVCTWTHSKRLSLGGKPFCFLHTCFREVYEKPWQRFWWDLPSNKSYKVVPPFKSRVRHLSLNHARFQLEVGEVCLISKGHAFGLLFRCYQLEQISWDCVCCFSAWISRTVPKMFVSSWTE